MRNRPTRSKPAGFPPAAGFGTPALHDALVTWKHVCASGLAAAILLLAGCQTPGQAPLSAADITAIRATTEAWLQAVRAGDRAGLAATYTEDAVLMPAHAPDVRGRRNIEAWFEKTPPVESFDLEITEIEGFGDLAYVRGTYTVTTVIEGLEPVTDSGKYLDVRRRQADGSWLFIRDMFASDLPCAPGQ